ncbi:sorbosone dehydrogenase family protein [Sphingomonas panacisoli]|uniref:Sorbosone dehydrogenase family protein n=1 Tax=Sphingomonas panacisoli TaxID=1813879 RepID=A0A5B8LIW4_9SPHN|nr:sorbosone dehydrogenase family protein [Sphingomonas panacisoli]QDZ08123.1 sorbosone dehydrogenase family protein [Sphingomonas panacisoli]
MTIRALLSSSPLIMLAACSGGGGNADDQIGPNPKLPAINQYLMPPMHVASVEPWANGATPTVAAGLRITAFASDFHNVRSVYTLPNGDVLAVEAKAPEEPVARPKDILVGFIQGFGHSKVRGESRIILLRDADGDGKPEVRTVLIDHLNAPFGVALVGGDLYVANTDAILRYPYVPGQTQITAKPTVLTELPGGPIDHHWTKSLVASPDGSKLYVGIGSNSNITENGIEAEKDRARIWEVDRSTGAHRDFATGLRNPTGLSFEPTSNQLWTVVNERDELGPDLVPDYMTSVRDGSFYGWPYSYYGQNVDPRVQPQRPDLVARAIPPDYALSSHVAPLGMAFSANAAALPPQFRSGAFVGEHGSWNRGNLNGYKVIYIPFVNGRPAGKPVDVVTGFIKDGKAQGRPVGVAIDRRGALLIADDGGNVVWRVTGK